MCGSSLNIHICTFHIFISDQIANEPKMLLIRNYASFLFANDILTKVPHAHDEFSFCQGKLCRQYSLSEI